MLEHLCTTEYSELVSGFNVEYGGGGLALIFFFGGVCKYSFYKFVVLYYFLGQ